MGVAGYHIISAPNESVHKIMGVGVGVFGGMLLAIPEQAKRDFPTLFSYAAISGVVFSTAASKGVDVLQDTGYGACVGATLGFTSSFFSQKVGSFIDSFTQNTKRAKLD